MKSNIIVGGNIYRMPNSGVAARPVAQQTAFRQVTADAFAKMSSDDQLNYVQQYIQIYKSTDPSLLQLLSRISSQQPAKQV